MNFSLFTAQDDNDLLDLIKLRNIAILLYAAKIHNSDENCDIIIFGQNP
jgi:hypothetical protein